MRARLELAFEDLVSSVEIWFLACVSVIEWELHQKRLSDFTVLQQAVMNVVMHAISSLSTVIRHACYFVATGVKVRELTSDV